MEALVMYNSDDQISGADENSRDAAVTLPKSLGDKLYADNMGNTLDSKNDQTSGGTDCEATRMKLDQKNKNGAPDDREKPRRKEKDRTCREDRESKNNKRKKEKERDKNRDRDQYYEKDRDRARGKSQNFHSHNRKLLEDHRLNKSNKRDRERSRELFKHRERNSKGSWKNERFEKRHRTTESPQRKICVKNDRQSEASSRERNTSMIIMPACDISSKLQNSNVGYCEENSFSNGNNQLATSTSNETGLPLSGNTKTECSTLPSYFNPNNSMRYTERAQKRKLLWSHKKPEDTPNKWGNAKFAQDTDGKVASKFMRLMGMKRTSPKGGAIHTNLSSGVNTESIKKREEMFSSMEQQYELARQVTHTMRGVGLGFNSQQRQF